MLISNIIILRAGLATIGEVLLILRQMIYLFSRNVLLTPVELFLTCLRVDLLVHASLLSVMSNIRLNMSLPALILHCLLHWQPPGFRTRSHPAWQFSIPATPPFMAASFR